MPLAMQAAMTGLEKGLHQGLDQGLGGALDSFSATAESALAPVALLPFELQLPLTGLLLAAAAWLILTLLACRWPAGSLARVLLRRIRFSLSGTLLLGGLAWWLAALSDPQLIDLARDGAEIRDLVVTLGLVWTLLRVKGELLQRADHYSAQLLPRLDPKDRLFLFDVIDKLIAGGVVVILVLQVLALLGVSAAVLITAGGFGAAAIGFGAQTIVQNSLSGLSLYINRPFIVGDFIEMPAENLAGTVEAIGWFYTRLRSADRQPIFIPNGLFTTKPVLNVAEIDSRRVWIEFGLSYEDRRRIEPIVAALRAWMAAQPAIDQDKPAAVHFVGYGESSLNLRLVCHGASGDVFDAWDLQQQLLLQIGEVVEEHGAAMPYPTRTLIPSKALRPDLTPDLRPA